MQNKFNPTARLASLDGLLETIIPAFLVSNFQWKVDGPAYADIYYTDTFGTTYPLTNTTSSNVVFYWAKEFEATVKWEAKLNGSEVKGEATFDVRKPEVSWTLTPKFRACVTNGVWGCPTTQALTTGLNYTENNVGMLYQLNVVNMKGYTNSSAKFQLAQLATLDWKDNRFSTLGDAEHRQIFGTGMDGESGYPMRETNLVSSTTWTDTPFSSLPSNYTYKWRADAFESNLMFKPVGGVPVPLKCAVWNWSGQAERVGTNAPYTFVESGTFVQPQASAGTSAEIPPEWTNSVPLIKANFTWESGWLPTP